MVHEVKAGKTTRMSFSSIKEALETWYSDNLSGVDSQIVSNPGFCNDRELQSGTGNWVSTGSIQYYAAYERRNNGNPTYECSNSNDLYQTKIGLITADEVIYAGGSGGTTNYGYYLYTGYWYWTISPTTFFGTATWIHVVATTGILTNDRGNRVYRVRPVINITTNITIAGEGTINIPYIVS